MALENGPLRVDVVCVLHHPVAGSTDILAKKPEISLWEDVAVLEVETTITVI